MAAGQTSWVWTLKGQKQVAAKTKQEFPLGSPQACWRGLGGDAAFRASAGSIVAGFNPEVQRLRPASVSSEQLQPRLRRSPSDAVVNFNGINREKNARLRDGMNETSEYGFHLRPHRPGWTNSKRALSSSCSTVRMGARGPSPNSA